MPSLTAVSDDLIARRKRDFGILAMANLAAYVLQSIFGYSDNSVAVPLAVIMPFMIVIIALLYYFLYRVTANFVEHKTLKRGYALLIIMQCVLGAIINRDIPPEQYSGLSMLNYFLQLSSLSIIFWVIVKDMFLYRHDSNYGILAAINAYLLLPIIFGYIFTIVGHINPAQLGVQLESNLRIIQAGFQVSYFVAAGFDVPDGTGIFIQRIAVIESLFTSLYIVFVVGRLLGGKGE
ncbi:MAG: hypothetical protein JST14_16085 [Bacteroidetes bacterium]|nr:hypothetical protein [Bacteroidota bacterium]